MRGSFARVPQANIQRSVFNRSHGWKGTFDAGWIVPILVDEVLPGDTFNLSMSGFARLATPEFPFMDNLWIDVHYFFVPNRLVQTNWQKLMGEQDNPGDSISYLAPVVTTPAVTGFAAESLYDYFGIPTGVVCSDPVNFAGRAYNLIYNKWYRNQNVIDSLPVDMDDGPDDPADYVIQNRHRQPDYFSSALPWPQKGDSVEIPLSGSVPVTLTGTTPYAGQQLRDTAGALFAGAEALQHGGGGTSWLEGTPSGTKAILDPNGSMNVLLQNATNPATINELRTAVQLQRFYERDARGGTRYIEILYSHFGVVSPDARLQIPEFLGSGRLMINVHPIAQTSESGTTPQGNLAAFGTASGKSGFSKSFVEHGIVLGLASMRGDRSYQQGLNRMWTRRARMEFYWPEFAHLGEQAILNEEIYADGSGNDLLPFGYIPRFDEYRYFPSLITGQFRSNFAQSLDAWHLAEDFAVLPELNELFLVNPPPVGRVLAVPTETHIIMDVHFNMKCVRPMPVHAVPGMMDHF